MDIRENELEKNFYKIVIKLWNVLSVFLVIPVIEIVILCLFYNL